MSPNVPGAPLKAEIRFARRAAKHKTSVLLAAGKATPCALSAIFGARAATRLRVSAFRAQQVNFVVRSNHESGSFQLSEFFFKPLILLHNFH